MPLTKEMRLLQTKWQSGQGWPKRLEWLEIKGIRGWTGQMIEFPFPIVALVGGVPERIGRPPSETIDVCNGVMTLSDEHEWVSAAANRLLLGTTVLWQALSAQWAKECLNKERDGRPIADAILEVLGSQPSIKPIYDSTVQPPLL